MLRGARGLPGARSSALAPASAALKAVAEASAKLRLPVLAFRPITWRWQTLQG